GDAEARAIAEGKTAKRGPPAAAATTRIAMRNATLVEVQVTPEEAHALEAENAELRRRIGELEQLLQKREIPDPRGAYVGPPGPPVEITEHNRINPDPRPAALRPASECRPGQPVDEDLYEAVKAR